MSKNGDNSKIPWNCDICNSGDSFPMMIVKCGHTYCESCLCRLDKCPACRTVFSLVDCQPNFYLAKPHHQLPETDSKQAVRRSDANLETRLKDLFRSKTLHIKSRVKEIAESLYEQVSEQVTEYPDRLIYQCKVTNPNKELLQCVKNYLEPNGLTLRLEEKTLEKLAEYPDEMEISVAFLNQAITGSRFTSGATGTTTSTAASNPFVNLLDMYMYMPASYSTTTN